MNAVTLIGAGFGALTAVRTLRKLDRGLQIDLVAPQPVFVFYPGTIWIPTDKSAPEEFEVPLQRFFQRMDVRYHEGRVTAMADDGRSVRVGTQTLTNDGLIIASGAAFLDRPEGREYAFLPCGGVKEIVRLRDRLHSLKGGTLAFGFAGNPDEPRAMRGGPVFEFMFGIETWLRRRGLRDAFRIVFFSPAAEPGKRLGAGAMRRILGEMQRRGIETRLGARPTRFESDRVVTDHGEFAADLIVWMPGMTGPAWLDNTSLPRSPGGLIAADDRCRVAGFERVYAVGDVGSHSGPEWLPKQAHSADLHGATAARNLVAELHGQPAERRFHPELVCVVDTGDRGMLITRSERRAMALPPWRAVHWAKRLFKWNYVRQYRR